MKVETKTLRDIFTPINKYKIPFFQRSYVWNEELWSRFIEDMKYVSSLNSGSYFFGSIILEHNTGYENSRSIIDGQQRITTFSLFLKAFSLIIKNEETRNSINQAIYCIGTKEPILTPSDNDSEDFLKCMEHQSTNQLSGDSQIIKCFNYFLKNINTNEVDFLKIISHISLIWVELEHGDNSQQIFDSFNSIGVKLTTSDLLKNYFFSKENIDSYQKSWKKIFDDDSKYWETNYTLGNSSKRNLSDLFFFSFLQIMINSESSKSITSGDRTMYRRYDKLFDSYKHFSKTYFSEEKNKLLNLICDFAKKFKEVINCEASKENITKEFGLNRINNVIFSLNQSTLIPLILYIEFFNKSLDERNKIYELLETLIVRRMVSNESAKNYNNFFTETLISKGYTYSSIYNEIYEAEKRAPGFIPNDQTIKERLKTLKFDNKKSKGILFFLESRIHSNKDASNLYPFKKYELEHIMPKKWKDEWPKIKDFSDSKMDKLIKNIGNHTLLTKKLNSEYKNKSWKIKGSELKKYSNGLHLIDSIDFTKQWDEQTINKRSEEFGRLICEYWPKF